MRAIRLLCAVGSAASAAVLWTGAFAQTYPVKPVRVLIGFPAGSGTDLVGRMTAAKISELWSAPVVVDNRPGAGANIAAELVAKAPPDGYTLLVAQNALAISPSLYPKLGYDPVKELTAAGGIAAAPHILLVHPSFPAKSVKELIALARRRPGELTFGSAGVGSNDHMCGELFRMMSAVKAVHVPYKGGNQVVADVMSGQIAYYFAGMPVGLPLHKSGKLRALAVTSKERYKGVPDLPTVHESGVTGYDVILWQALFAPAGTPPNVLTRISTELSRARRANDLRDRLAASGVEVLDVEADDFNKFFRNEVAKWDRVVKEAGLKAD